MQRLERGTEDKKNHDCWSRHEIETMIHLSALHGVEFVGLFSKEVGVTYEDGQKLITRQFDHEGIVTDKLAPYTHVDSTSEAWRLFDYHLAEYLAEKTKVLWKRAPELMSIDGIGWTVLAELVAWAPKGE